MKNLLTQWETEKENCCRKLLSRSLFLAARVTPGRLHPTAFSQAESPCYYFSSVWRILVASSRPVDSDQRLRLVLKTSLTLKGNLLPQPWQALTQTNHRPHRLLTTQVTGHRPHRPASTQVIGHIGRASIYIGHRPHRPVTPQIIKVLIERTTTQVVDHKSHQALIEKTIIQVVIILVLLITGNPSLRSFSSYH